MSASVDTSYLALRTVGTELGQRRIDRSNGGPGGQALRS